MASFIVTGAPGAGKTTLLDALAERGFPVVAEAATDIIAAAQRAGIARPWEQTDFIASIMALQMARMKAAPDGALHDRSVICTLALCRFLEQPVPPELLQACTAAQEHFAPQVFFLRLLGFMTASDARKISYEESQRFEGYHEAAYREFGFMLVDIPAAPVADRATLVAKTVRAQTR